MRHKLTIVSLTIVWGLLISSCSTTKPLLSEIPRKDLNSRIYFFDTGLFDSGWKTRKISDSTDAFLSSGGFDFTLFPLGKSAPFESSLSPFGDFLATHHDKVRLVDLKLSSREIDFAIYDLRKKEFILDMTTTIPFPEFKADAYRIEWSVLDSGFFYVDSDTLKKCYPNGGRCFLTFQEGLRAFSVSPSEKQLLLVQSDTVKLLSSSDHNTQTIATSISSQKKVRAVSWFPTESLVAYAIGWRVYIYDIGKQSLSEHKADGHILWTEWLQDGTLVYTEGTFPSDLQTMPSTESFRICRLFPNTNETKVLHERINHSPYSVRPRLSPSGTLLLFSERRLNGGYEVKLMSLDGQQMNTICDGIDPSWGK